MKADDIDQQFEIRYLLRSAKQYFIFHFKGSLSGVSRKLRPSKHRPQTSDLENPDLENPDLENPDLENTDLENTDLENPDLAI